MVKKETRLKIKESNKGQYVNHQGNKRSWKKKIVKEHDKEKKTENLEERIKEKYNCHLCGKFVHSKRIVKNVRFDLKKMVTLMFMYV